MGGRAWVGFGVGGWMIAVTSDGLIVMGDGDGCVVVDGGVL